MPIEILMPAVSPSMVDGGLALWHKKEGDLVKVGDLLVEVETDKAVVEVQAEKEGILGKILFPSGSQNIKINTPIAILLESGEDALSLASIGKSAVTPSQPTVEENTVALKQDRPIKKSDNFLSTTGRIFASPLARRIAADHQIDLSRIMGSGPGGRIVKKDLNSPSYIDTAKPVVHLPGDKETPNSSMRKMIANRLSEAKRTIPHFYLSVDCEIDKILAMKLEINESVDGAKVSVNDFVIKAVSMALRKFPQVNSSWGDLAIKHHQNVDIAVAVSTTSGLITPIIKNVDQKSLISISSEIKNLAERGRSGKLSLDEYQGGGITVSNLGMYGVREFSAIINPPQSCILAIGAGEQRPIVKNNTIVIATMMTCTLSADHRVVDGTLGAQFIAEFKRIIEHPIKMVL